MSLITVYFKEKNGNFKYTKCIIPKEKLDFFEKLGAVKTQVEAETKKDEILKTAKILKPAESKDVQLEGTATVSTNKNVTDDIKTKSLDVLKK